MKNSDDSYKYYTLPVILFFVQVKFATQIVSFVAAIYLLNS